MSAKCTCSGFQLQYEGVHSTTCPVRLQREKPQPQKLLYIAMAEGFCLLSFSPKQDGSEGELIDLLGFTQDIRKATPIVSKAKAYGVAKFLAKNNYSRRQYYCIMEATNESD